MGVGCGSFGLSENTSRAQWLSRPYRAGDRFELARESGAEGAEGGTSEEVAEEEEVEDASRDGRGRSYDRRLRGLRSAPGFPCSAALLGAL